MTNPPAPLGSNAGFVEHEATGSGAHERAGDALADDTSIDETDILELAPYTMSNDETLVGLGPPSSRDPARGTATGVGVRGKPQSEPPGPWGSDDEDVLPPSLRRKNTGIWGVAVPLLVAFTGVVVLALRGLSSAPAPSAAAMAIVTPAPEPSFDTGVLVKLTNPGVRVKVDGRDRGVPPVLIMGLEPGSHVVSIAGEGFAPFEQPLLLTANHVSTLEPVLVAAERAPVATAPSVDGPSASEPAAESKSSAATTMKTPATMTAATMAATNGAHPVHAHGVKPIAVQLDEAPAGAAATPSGMLAISSNPPANVVVDGRPLGKSPRAVDVAPGVHSVVFIHPELGRRSLTVNVTPGKPTAASVDF